MATTAQQAMDLALQRSALNNPDLVPPAQVIRYIAQFEKAAYLLAAKLQPEYFGSSGDTGTRAAFGDSWPLTTAPGGIASVTKAEVKTITGSVTDVSVGDQINLISFRWPSLGLAPRAYIRGRDLFGYLVELGAADANMVTVATIYFAVLPTAPTALTTTLTIPDEWIDLVYLPLARVFAIRDSRPTEAEVIQGEFTEARELFKQSLGVYDGGAVKPINSVPVATALDGQG